VASLGRDGGYEAVNRAFGDPPHSTEQIIHPEKYLTHEEPVDVSLPDLAAALGPGWTLLRSDVLGELDVRILLEQFGDPVTAAKGSEGWGGDRYAFLENAAGQDALLISTAWDSEGDAGEFFDLYADTVRRRYGARASRTADSPARIAWATPNGALLLQRWGPRVGVAIASDDRTANSLIAAISPAPPAQPTPSPTPTGPVPAPVQVPR
jgi:hypothetical protein